MSRTVDGAEREPATTRRQVAAEAHQPGRQRVRRTCLGRRVTSSHLSVDRKRVRLFGKRPREPQPGTFSFWSASFGIRVAANPEAHNQGKIPEEGRPRPVHCQESSWIPDAQECLPLRLAANPEAHNQGKIPEEGRPRPSSEIFRARSRSAATQILTLR